MQASDIIFCYVSRAMQCSGTTSNDQEREITKQSMRPAQSSAEINGVSLHRLVPTSFKA